MLNKTTKLEAMHIASMRPVAENNQVPKMIPINKQENGVITDATFLHGL